MKITLIAVGKIKEKYLSDAIREYSKRLLRFCTLRIIETADEKTPDSPSEGERRAVLKREGDRILDKIPENAYVCAFEVDGELISSPDIAGIIEEGAVRGKGHIVFVIGGSLGLDERVSERADRRISLGRVTYPHQLMRVIALEQIYRGFKILKNEPYHK